MIAIGAFIQSAIGFGLAIAAAPLLYFLDPAYVPAPITFVGLLLSLVNAAHYRQNLNLKPLAAAIVGRIPGSLAGGALLLWIDARELALVIGTSVLLAVLISLLPFRLAPTRNRMAVAGFFSGLFGTSSGIGGPPMALLLQHQAANAIRANLAAFFVVSASISLLVQAGSGYIQPNHLVLTLPLLPACLVGYWLAKRYAKNLRQDHMRLFSLALCSITGVVAIAQYFTGG
ncbi:sulfite exporter TauE/SafE family protein [Neiella marina]|uniref:Probable membrane transporter protein n=2 Tax=Neiella holothuriorum TaxID=2870530 RepID=A0ABS7EIR8_9GAMM|nr:sulfite exporter TauE/SafE family protein [Neiella holothuriorum]